MPEKTLRAFADHGEVTPTLMSDPFGAERTLADATAAGIELPEVTAELEREGIEAFCTSYHELLDCVRSELSVGTGLSSRHGRLRGQRREPRALTWTGMPTPRDQMPSHLTSGSDV